MFGVRVFFELCTLTEHPKLRLNTELYDIHCKDSIHNKQLGSLQSRKLVLSKSGCRIFAKLSTCEN